MNWNTSKGYVETIFGGLIILAGVVLVILQWGNHAEFSLYGKNIDANTAVLILASLAAGIALIPVCKLFIRGLLALRAGRREDTINHLSRVEKEKKNANKAEDTQ